MEHLKSKDGRQPSKAAHGRKGNKETKRREEFKTGIGAREALSLDGLGDRLQDEVPKKLDVYSLAKKRRLRRAAKGRKGPSHAGHKTHRHPQRRNKASESPQRERLSPPAPGSEKTAITL